MNKPQLAYFANKVAHKENINEAKVIYGNKSRFGKNWIAGPKNEVREQHIPGYTGHVKGLIAENMHGENFANCTARAIYRKSTYGYDIKPKYRFNSQN